MRNLKTAAFWTSCVRCPACRTLFESDDFKVRTPTTDPNIHKVICPECSNDFQVDFNEDYEIELLDPDGELLDSAEDNEIELLDPDGE